MLNGVSARVAGGARVGVCGRTGSGKSSLFRALLRLTEFDGEILIDGVAASRAPLRALRGALALVQQDPMLFSGSVRHNVDPTGARADADVRAALDASALAHLGLDAPVDEGGANFSAGERQLLCVARALLVRPRILLLDEATSMLDRATDEAVQRALRALAGATLVTIAHRLETIADADLVVVLDAGRVAESGPPRELLARDGAYAALVRRHAPAPAPADEPARGADCLAPMLGPCVE